jgi:hypothetical protein
MMPTYCTDADLTDLLPDNLPVDIDSETERASWITRGSALVDARIGPRFVTGVFEGQSQKFPDITHTPATPEVIREIAALMSASVVLDHLGVDGSGEGGETSRQRAYAMIDEICAGTIHVVDSVGTTYGRVAVGGTRDCGVPTFSRGRFASDGECLEEGTLDAM